MLLRLSLYYVVALVFFASSALAQNSVPKDWWVAITNDRAEHVTKMLEQGANPNEISPMGQPAIMQAIRDDAWKVYDVLVNHPQTVFNAINVNRETPLMYLAVIGDTQRAKALIQRGAMVNRKGWTPLHYAVSTGKVETAQMLLDHGADVNAPAPDGTTPLMMAAYSGSEPAVNLLLRAGADPHRRNRQDYDVVDWAGFKSNTRLAGKLRELLNTPSTETAGHDLNSEMQSSTKADLGQESHSVTGTPSTSRYFDLDRFNEPATR